MHRHFSLAAISRAALLTGFLILFAFQNGNAQFTTAWTPAQRIPGYSDSVLPPYMYADNNQTVHAFSSDWVGVDNQELAILYSQWTPGGGWTLPNDVLLPPFRNQAWVQGLYYSPDGYFHLIFFGGDDRDARIYYTKAPALMAWDASAWDPPKIIGENAKTPRTTFLIGRGTSELVVVYSSNIEGNGLYVVYSDDQGVTWSDPETLFLTFSDDLSPSSLDMHLGESGITHAVWNVVDPTGANISGHYARYDFADRAWSLPINFDESVGLGIAVPTVMELDQQVFMVYNNGISGGVAPAHWMKVSQDYGLTWSPPQRAFPTHIGRNGLLSLVTDASKTLHIFFGQRTYGSIHGMWHSVLGEMSWGVVEPVTSGPMIQGTEGVLGFDPYDARAVVVQGNNLLVTWRTDPGNSRNGVWFSISQLDLTPFPLQTLEVPVPTPPESASTSPPGDASLPSPAPSDVRLPSDNPLDVTSPGTPINPRMAIAYSVIPVIFIVITIVVVFGYRSGSRS